MIAPSSSRLDAAFKVAVAELGRVSGARLFVREVAAVGGEEAVEELLHGFCRARPILDAVTRQWLLGERSREVSCDGALAVCEGAARVVVTGLETDFLDALVSRLDRAAEIAIVQESFSEVDWERVLSNFRGRVQGVSLGDFQRWAGRRSVLLVSAYGTREHVTYVDPCSLRVLGPDVRMQFRSVAAWEVLGRPLHLYPRSVHDVPLDMFSELV